MSDNADKMTNALIQLAETYDPLIAAAAGHRVKLVEAGFDEHFAQEMAAEFYRNLLNLTMKS